jgi:hypothetical protein
MDSTFRLPVFRQLILRDILVNRQSSLIFLGVLSGLIALAGLLAASNGQGVMDWQDFHLKWYGILFYLIGILHTGGVFGEFKRPATLQDYLLLPASHLEKWLSRWFRSLPVYLLTFTVSYIIAALVMQLLIYLVRKEAVPFFNPFDTMLLRYWKWYVLIQAVMLVGAVQFNRNAALKTVLALLAALFSFGILTGLVQMLLFRDLMENGFFDGNSGLGLVFSPELIMERFEQIFPWILWLLILPFLWWISFLKLTEKEV